VIEKLDHDGFLLPDQKSFSLLLRMYGKACQVCCLDVKKFKDVKSACEYKIVAISFLASFCR